MTSRWRGIRPQAAGARAWAAAARRALRALIACAAAALVAGAPVPASAQPDAARQTALAPAAIRQILRHGPWPPPWRPDPSNRVSGNPDAARLGRRLFFDARLSPSGRVSCSSCHRPERGWSDGRARGIGLAEGRRNTIGLLDVRLNRWFGWDGAGDSLWGQSLRPILDPGEMGSSAAHLKGHLASDPELASAYAAVFGRAPADADEEVVLVDAAKALAAYQETIVSPRTPFDDFRDALAAGATVEAAGLPRPALRGLAMFVGAGRCSSCHAGPAFTDGTFRVGLGSDGAGAPASARPSIDPARRGGIAKLRSSPYNLWGAFSDDPERRTVWRRAELAVRTVPAGAFRVPSLRNLAGSAPYMHDGSRASIADAVGSHPPGARRLTAGEVAELVAFLSTLSARPSGP